MPNRLASESSPYLLQHAENPVDWYPWSAEALNKAREEEKPIFLSVGYSACHWCHVMEHESFENRQIADYLNEHFVSIKVDREERPDIDQIYMQAVLAMQGQGGWPLSAFLTPDQDFFFGGTYWPPTTSAQMPGFDRVLASVLDAWQNRREEVVQQSRQITQMINQPLGEPQPATTLDPVILAVAAQLLHQRWDSTWGGFGTAPKFPHPMDLSLLLNLYRRDSRGYDEPTGDQLLQMTEVTLQKMAAGGIYDHLAGGFARYSVDSRWLVPHFEKMLYDNALLARVYLLAWQITQDDFYRRICEETLGYLQNYLTDPTGAIYSTEDADSEGEEGKFYVWSIDQVREVLGAAAEEFCKVYDVTPSGNFEGHNILNLPRTIAEFARDEGLDYEELSARLADARGKLLHLRNQRVRPGLDDKVLTSWNALAIEAFAAAAIVLDNEQYAVAAERAAAFLWSEVRGDDGRLLHTWRHGTAKLAAYLDDYACFISALVTLYRVRFDPVWIDRANRLAGDMQKHFQHVDGGFYFTADDHEQLIARTTEFQDSAVPSGNSMAATGLMRLGRTTGNMELVEMARQTIDAAGPLLQRAPLGASQTLVAYDALLHADQQLVLIRGANEEENEQAIRALQRQVDPGQVLIVASDDAVADENHPLHRMLAGKQAVDGRAALYVCRGIQCNEPVIGGDEIETFATTPR
ncbi:MAG: thioredoxin domain-containing protein [Pirellulaceae bacterium]